MSAHRRRRKKAVLDAVAVVGRDEQIGAQLPPFLAFAGLPFSLARSHHHVVAERGAGAVLRQAQRGRGEQGGVLALTPHAHEQARARVGADCACVCVVSCVLTFS